MKVKELIKKLKEYNPDADVSLTTSEEITLGYIFKTEDGKEYTKETTKQVFIEPCDECPSCDWVCSDDKGLWCSFYENYCSEIDECYNS